MGWVFSILDLASLGNVFQDVFQDKDRIDTLAYSVFIYLTCTAYSII